MADEIVEILRLDIDVDAALTDAKKLKQQIDDLKTKTKEMKGTEKELSDEYIIATQQIKAYQKELSAKEAVIQKTITAQNSQQGSLNQLRAELQKNTIAVNEMAGATEEEIKLRDEQIKKNQELKEKIVELEKAQGNYTGQVGNYELATKSVKQELKELIVQMQSMAARGEDGSEAFKTMAARAGQLKDAMNATNDQVKSFAYGDDLEKKLKIAKSGFDGAAGAASTFEGVMALSGAENENVTKSIQKLVAIQSVSTGVTQIYEAVQKESALMMGLSAAKTALASTAQATYTTIVGTSTGALKAFRIALAATGIGAIIALVATLVMNWDKLTEAIGGSARAMAEYNKSKEKINLTSEIWKKKIQDEIDLLRAKGATEEEIAKKERELYELSIAQTEALIKNQDKLVDAKQKELEKAQDQLKAAEILNAATFGANTALVVLAKARIENINNEIIGINNTTNSYKNNLAEQKRQLDLFDKEKDKIRKDNKEKEDKEAADRLKSQQEENKKRLEDQATALDKSIELEKLRTQKIRDSRLINEGVYQNEVKTVESFEQKQLDALKFRLDKGLIEQKDYEISKQQIINDSEAEIQDIKYARSQAAIEQMQFELEVWKYDNKSKLDFNKEVNDDLVNQERIRLEDQAALDIEFAEKSIENEDERAFAVRQIKEKLTEDKKLLDEDYENWQKDRAAVKAQTDFDNEMAALESTWFAKLDLQKANLEKQKQLELKNAEKTGADKNLIEKKYAKASREIELAKANAALSVASNLSNSLIEIFGKQSKVGKAAAVAATIISTIQGSVNALTGMIEAIPGPVGIVLGAVAAAGVAASGYANVQKILSVNTDVESGSSGSVSADTSATSSISSASSEITRQSATAEVGQGIVSRSTGTADQTGNATQVAVIVDEVTAKQNEQLSINRTKNL